MIKIVENSKHKLTLTHTEALIWLLKIAKQGATMKDLQPDRDNGKIFLLHGGSMLEIGCDYESRFAWRKLVWIAVAAMTSRSDCLARYKEMDIKASTAQWADRLIGTVFQKKKLTIEQALMALLQMEEQDMHCSLQSEDELVRKLIKKGF